MPNSSPGLLPRFGGLLGRVYNAFDGALLRVFVVCVVGAAVISIVENTGLRAGNSYAKYWSLLLLGIGAIIAELMGVHRALMAWHRAQKGQTFAWIGVWIIGFGFSVYNAIGSAADTQVKRANFQKAAMVSYQDVRTGLDAARDRVKAEEKSVTDLKRMTWQEMPKVAGKAIMSADAADALVKSYEGNTRMWDLTSKCTDAQGRQARKFCAEHGEAKAARADLKERTAWQAKVEAAERQLAEARTALGNALEKNDNTKVETSEVTPFVGLVSYVTGAAPEKVQWVETFQTSFTNMLLVSLAGVVMAFMAIEGQTRTKWFNFRARWWRIRAALFGGSSTPPAQPVPGGPSVTHNVTVNARMKDAIAAELDRVYGPAKAAA